MIRIRWKRRLVDSIDSTLTKSFFVEEARGDLALSYPHGFEEIFLLSRHRHNSTASIELSERMRRERGGPAPGLWEMINRMRAPRLWEVVTREDVRF